MKSTDSSHRYCFRYRHHRGALICLLSGCVYLSCTSGGFDVAGGASDIGNSQERQGIVPDTCGQDKDAIIIDILNGTIYTTGEDPLRP